MYDIGLKMYEIKFKMYEIKLKMYRKWDWSELGILVLWELSWLIQWSQSFGNLQINLIFIKYLYPEEITFIVPQIKSTLSRYWDQAFGFMIIQHKSFSSVPIIIILSS